MVPLLNLEEVKQLSNVEDVESFYMFVFKMLPCSKVRRTVGVKKGWVVLAAAGPRHHSALDPHSSGHNIQIHLCSSSWPHKHTLPHQQPLQATWGVISFM